MTLALIGAYPELADWLWLIAAILFTIAAVLLLARRPDPAGGALVPIGLACAVVGWLVL
jgi:hypothetical membrane protein